VGWLPGWDSANKSADGVPPADGRLHNKSGKPSGRPGKKRKIEKKKQHRGKFNLGGLWVWKVGGKSIRNFCHEFRRIGTWSNKMFMIFGFSGEQLHQRIP
jgi:hypothetical protein